MDTSQSRERLSTDRATVPLHAKLASVCAAIIMFQTVLVLGAGFSWSLAGLLGLVDEVAWVGAALAFVLAVFSSGWLLCRALSVEKEAATEAVDPSLSSSSPQIGFADRSDLRRESGLVVPPANAGREEKHSEPGSPSDPGRSLPAPSASGS